MYAAVVERAGGIPVIVPLIKGPAFVAGLMERLDGLILGGGHDVTPRCYNEEPLIGLKATDYPLDLVQIEAAQQAAREESNSDTAALAKALAGRSARTVATHCQQVLAGIGFTTEHSFHRFLKRTIALEGLFGSSDEIVLDIGRQLLAKRRVPTLIEL